MSKLSALMALLSPRLAADADPEELKKDLKNIVEDDDEEEGKKKADDSDDEDDDKDGKSKADDEQTQAEKDNESEAERLKEREAREKEDRERDRKEANDAAVAAAGAHYKALREAERICQPFVGQVACDSADEVYRMTLEHAGVKGVKSLPSVALRPMVEMLQTRSVAQDSAPVRLTGSVEADVLKMIRGGK